MSHQFRLTYKISNNRMHRETCTMRNFDGSQDHPQSLFEGVKGIKVVKLAISTVLSAIALPTEDKAEIVRLCSVAINAINSGLIDEWIEQRGSGQQLIKLREKAEGNLDCEMLHAVFTFPQRSNYSILNSYLF